MPSIKQMDQKLANMIAAGEVVNRPASVLKELIENAIDAQASQIEIEVFDMGMTQLVVTDDGLGMDEIDAKLAFSRHATSKIKTESDLSHIATLGFRGEALAAIASVSKVTLKTRQKDAQGYQVTYHAGQLIDEGAATLNQGTVVSVSDLFYNTPARFKYIKSEIAEKFALIDMFDRLALSHPNIAFKLVMDQQVIKETFGQGDDYALIDQIYGKNITKNMIYFNQTVQKIEIKGYLISPQISRSRKKDISLFINGRYIKNYVLTQAIISGYDGFLMVNRYPIALIHLKLDPSLVDVNVHPQKFEVKFVNESLLGFHIETLIKKALRDENHPILEVNQKESSTPSNTQVIQPLQMDDFFYEDHSFPLNESQTESTKTVKIPTLYYVGAFSGTYLLFQNETGLFLMDQHAAAERIRYEYYHQVLTKPKTQIKDMLIPKALTLTSLEIDQLKNYIQELKTYGFNFDENTQLIGIPMWLKDDEIDIAIDALLSMFLEKEAIDLGVLRDKLAKDISCKGAIKANKSLNQLEINQLVKDLSACENPYTCPHGRPTLIKLSHYEIEKLFKRVV